MGTKEKEKSKKGSSGKLPWVCIGTELSCGTQPRQGWGLLAGQLGGLADVLNGKKES